MDIDIVSHRIGLIERNGFNTFINKQENMELIVMAG